MKIDIISREVIKPSSPTPSCLRDFKLSLLDQMVPHSFYSLIVYYSADESNRVKQSEKSYLLRRWLSDALAQFYPLAGRMKGDSSVDCSDQGVDYLEARVDGRLSDVIEGPQTELPSLLIPYKLDDREFWTEVLLAIQANLFSCGGLAIGICVSHRIADAYTLTTFLKGWAATAGGERNLVVPSFVSASLFPPRDPFRFKPRADVPEEGLVTRRFVFSAPSIAALKAAVLSRSGVEATRVEVVSAVLWKGAMADNGCRSVAFHAVNLRGRMVPPLPEYSFGNQFLMANAVSDGETELTTLVGKLRGALKSIDSNYIGQRQGENGYDVAMSRSREIRELVSKGEVQIVRFSSWCGFPIYEADFGWGKPSWVSSAGFGVRNLVFLVDSRWAGGIEAWVTLREQDMPKFEQHMITSLQNVSSSSTS